MRHGGVTFTVVLALLLSTMFMSVAGGTLTPHERRTLGTAFAAVLGDAHARKRLSAALAAPYVVRRSVHLVPTQPIALPGPPVDPDLALLGADLLGGDLLGTAPVLARAPEVLAVTQVHAGLSIDESPPLEETCIDKCLTPAAEAAFGEAAATDVATLEAGALIP
jgi:hypothetical protein